MKYTPPIPSCSNENFCFHVGDYSFGFNGKELDKEGMGGGASTYDYGFRIYNSALAKFLSVDPLSASFPWYTPYQFAGNKPIVAIDLDGLEEKLVFKPNPNIYTKAHFDFIANHMWPIYKTAQEKGCSIHGAFLICAMAWNESTYGTSRAAQRNNLFGFGGGTMSFQRIEDCVEYFFTHVEDTWPEFMNLLKQQGPISSDEINKTSNSGPYERNHNDFDNPLLSYNYDPASDEPTKVLREGVLTGMQDYGNVTINCMITMINCYIQYNTNLITKYEAQNSQIAEQLKNGNIPQETQNMLIAQMASNNKEILRCNSEIDMIKKVLVVTDTGTNKSSNNTNQDKSTQVEYKKNVKEVSSGN